MIALISRFKKSITIAAVAITTVAGFEGRELVAYYDPPGIPTICFGETRGVKITDTATPEECDAQLVASLDRHSAAIDKCLPPDLPEPSYIAFLSTAYNIGPTAFCKSSMARRTNAGDLRGGCDALLMWDKTTIGGVLVTLPGLKRRRVEERTLCLKGLL